MNVDFIRRMKQLVPRYTSYPTAPNFNGGVGCREFMDALRAVPAESDLSLYVHIPFCRQLCWYCGCNTKVVRRPEPVADYLASIEAEIAAVSSVIGSRKVTSLHWGGGSPNVLSAAQIHHLAANLRERFDVARSCEFSVEVDPRWIDQEQIAALADAGVTRVSIGVQDFDPKVQSAINREQSFDVTRSAVEAFRCAGIRSINLDLVYGLPHQTRESIASTIRQVLKLQPDRIALFAYAHLPSRAKHQSMIDERMLPNSVERFGQSRRALRLFVEAGYVAVGLDHFAKATDALAKGPIARNFQGYTTDHADALVGFGCSSISRLTAGYFQNAHERQDYARRIKHDGLATARGIIFNEDDKMRAYVIERLMCDFTFSRSQVIGRFGNAASQLICEADELLLCDQDDLVEKTADGFRITHRGQPFVRTIAACFDAYMDQSPGTFSAAI